MSIPDTTPDEPHFTPDTAEDMRVLVGDGQLPWPILRRFLTLIDDYLEVQIPDRHPDAGPFAPAAASQVTITAHGTWTLPWLVLRHSLNAVSTSGNIVENEPTPNSADAPRAP